MEKINLNEYLASNEYPGRGIAVAMAPDGRQMFIGYFIMGRSENSRNRVCYFFCCFGREKAPPSNEKS